MQSFTFYLIDKLYLPGMTMNYFSLVINSKFMTNNYVKKKTNSLHFQGIFIPVSQILQC